MLYSEQEACLPIGVYEHGFNPHASLPYGLTIDHIRTSMIDFLDFLGFINQQLYSKSLSRLENMLMPANFSSIVGEFMTTTIPKCCEHLIKNTYHNGHPDLIPRDRFIGNAVQHSEHGIEIKASRYKRGWQGHNPERCWLMVFVFDSNRPTDITPKPFSFIKVVGAQLVETDWNFSGRSETSRRTITASVTESGYQKMMANWIYRSDLEVLKA